MNLHTNLLKGGWGWLLLPLGIMLIGTNLSWVIFVIIVKDPALAGKMTLQYGPITWSFLQVILFLIARARLKKLNINLKELIGYDKNKLGKDIFYALVLAAIAVLIILGSFQLLDYVFGMSQNSDSPFAPFAIIWWIGVTSITAGIGEEIYFRGFITKRLARWNIVVLVFVQAIAFAIWHVAPQMLLHTFLFGLLFGFSFIKTQRLFPLIIAHILVDMAGGIMMLI